MLALGNGAYCAFENIYYMQHKRRNQNIWYQPLTLKIRFLVADKIIVLLQRATNLYAKLFSVEVIL